MLATSTPPTLREAFLFWLKLGVVSFGGPTAQLALLHAEVVERRKWIEEARFLHALNYCVLLPGPEATQLATYIGWMLHGTRGALLAGSLFVAPAALLLWALSWGYLTFGKTAWAAAVLYGLKPAIVAIIVVAMGRLGARVLRRPAVWIIAVAAFCLLQFASIPFPLVVVGAGLAGGLAGRFAPCLFPEEGGGTASPNVPIAAVSRRPSAARTAAVVLAGVCVWWLPILALGVWLGGDHAVVTQGVFFSQAAVVTFGGAYAVLSYVSQQAVETHGWLTSSQMLDGLALAETTPGPLIIVLQFVGFLGGWNQPGPLTPLVAATLGAFITTWATFVPSFLFILAGAPQVERLRHRGFLHATLAAITAAALGAMAGVALSFARQVFFHSPGVADWMTLAIAGGSFVCLRVWRWNVLWVVAGAGAAGLLCKMVVM